MVGIEFDPTENSDGFEASGSNQSRMRDRNERLVLSILRRQGPLPKAQIARKTGLSAQTVSVIMRALETDGLLEKGEKLRGKVGQPSVPMRLAPDGGHFFGLKVGRRSAELILVDFVGKEMAHVTQTYNFPTPAMILDFVTTSVTEITSKLKPSQRERLSGMGIASPFFLWEWATVIGVNEDEMADWKQFDLAAEIQALYPFPVYLENDASCACGAELVFGTTETPADFLYLYLGYFVGGGVVLNGVLYTGTSGNAGAIGPFPILDKTGKAQQLVDKASLIGLERRVAQASGDVSLMTEPWGDWDIDQGILDEWLDEAAASLALTIAGAISVIDFPTVLIDGNMPESLRVEIIERVKNALIETNLSGLVFPDILPGSLGPRARALGAASLPLSKRFMLEA